MIFVTGCARSGTSLITEILKGHGVALGEVNSLSENMAVREGVLKPYLRAIGADPLGQSPLPDAMEPCPALRASVEAAIGPLVEPWAYKDAKLALVWPVWADAFPQAKWVLVRRDAEKIAASCVRTPFMRAFTGSAGWLNWVARQEARFDEMRTHLDLIEVWTDEVIADPKAFAPVCRFLDLEFDVNRVENCIDRTRWH